MRRKLIAGNWKMNGSLAANAALLEGIKAELEKSHYKVTNWPEYNDALCPDVRP